MITLTRKGPFGLISRSVSLAGSWPGECESENEERVRATGPINLDLYHLTRENDNLIEVLVAEAERAGIQLLDFSYEEVIELRRAVWRSSHRFLVQNAHLIDRSPELEELAKILKVDK